MARRRAGTGAGQDAGRAAVPGTGDADRHRRRRTSRRPRPTGCAAPWRPSAASAPSAHFQRQDDRGHGGDAAMTRDFAERCFEQIEGFGSMASRKAMPRASPCWSMPRAWMKCHYPAAFAGALLNSQPMGFYAPAQIVRDAREHGVEVRDRMSTLSDWDCTLEERASRMARAAARPAPDRRLPRGLGAGEASRARLHARSKACWPAAACPSAALERWPMPMPALPGP